MMMDTNGVMEFITLGYTLDDKTMLKDKKLNYDAFPPFRVYDEPSTIDDVHEALKKSVEKNLESDMAISLSGGMDSRIIAGIVAELGYNDVPAFTFSHSRFEPLIARKVCSVLGLRHLTITLPPFDSVLMDDLASTALASGGTYRVVNTHVRKYVDGMLRKIGIQKVFTGGGFGYVRGGTSGSEVYSHISFVNSRMRHVHWSVPKQYREIVAKTLTDYCRNIPYRKLFPSVLIRNNYQDKAKWIGEVERVKRVHVLVDSEVLSAACSLPLTYGHGKVMSQNILRKFFPKISNIPYANSLLPTQIPTIIHQIMFNSVLTFYVRTGVNSPSPLVSYSEYQFVKQNLKKFKPLLLKHIPPFFKREDIKKTIRSLTPKGAKSLARILSYSVLCEEMEN